MPRLIDADEAYKVLTDYYHQRTKIQHIALTEALSRVPTVDAEPVVRCKDCEYSNGEYKYCVNDIFEIPNGYCSYGKRREDDE
jgi:hypothetical protein